MIISISTHLEDRIDCYSNGFQLRSQASLYPCPCIDPLTLTLGLIMWLALANGTIWCKQRLVSVHWACCLHVNKSAGHMLPSWQPTPTGSCQAEPWENYEEINGCCFKAGAGQNFLKGSGSTYFRLVAYIICITTTYLLCSWVRATTYNGNKWVWQSLTDTEGFHLIFSSEKVRLQNNIDRLKEIGKNLKQISQTYCTCLHGYVWMSEERGGENASQPFWLWVPE